MITALLFTLALMVPQEPKIVICTVIKVDERVSCPTENGTELFIFTEPAEAKDIFNEWRLRAPLQGACPNTDAPLYTVPVKEGDKVRAVIEGNTFREVADGRVRVYRNIKHWRMFRQGEIPPLILCRLPDDYQPWYGKNLQ